MYSVRNSIDGGEGGLGDKDTGSASRDGSKRRDRRGVDREDKQAELELTGYYGNGD